MTDDEKKARIRELNDELRRALLKPIEQRPRNARIIFVGSLGQEEEHVRWLVALASATFSTFTEENDPHQEHDFGKFKVPVDGKEREAMFKFDYYALDEMHGSEHPEDPNVTIRVMSLFYAEDY